MVLRNYVQLEPNVPAVMHFTGGSLQRRTIIERLDGKPKGVNALVLDVNELNGVAVSAQFSTLSEKLAAQLMPFVENKTIHLYRFAITQRGEGFTTDYTVVPTLISR